MLVLLNTLWLIIFLTGIAAVASMHLYKKIKGRQLPFHDTVSFAFFFLLILLSALTAYAEQGWSSRLILYILLLGFLISYAGWKSIGRKNRS
ncbi:hypothetical protein ACFOGI_00710 [Virgibacillus xinjiangensis]|uniref:YtpI-like protein n=1 Tax=Virgibacillus xinjiangensis TaxID=393090 RepID=A0ABV7CR40_9BACI